MARRLLIIVAIAALGGVAFWATQQPAEKAPVNDLVVKIRVVDPEGKPVPGAQVRRRFTRESWQGVDDNGEITLEGLPLHEGHKPAAASLSAAVLVRARFLGVRSEPTVAHKGGTTWDMTMHLAPHGVVRLSIATTHLAPVKAWLDPDPLGRIETMGGRNVARLDRDAAFRIMPGLSKLVVRVEGGTDPLGVIRAASQRIEFDAPNVGAVSQIVIKPEEARPIVGEVRISDPSDPEGSVATEAGGEVVVHMIENDKPTHELGRVPIDEGGMFLVPFSGIGPYALTVHRHRYAPGPMKVAAGETEVSMFLGRQLPSLRLTHREIDPKRRIHVGAGTKGRKGTFTVGEPQQERTWTRVVFKEPPGHVIANAMVLGTHSEPPLTGHVELDVAASGETEAPIELTEAPFATVVLECPDATDDAVGTATLVHRRATLIPSVKPKTVIKHVEAVGSATVRVRWKDTTRAYIAMHVQLDANATRTVTLPYVEGGFVSWDGDAKGHAPRMQWSTSPNEEFSVISFERHEGMWRTDHALMPGDYEATLDGTPVTFSVIAGKTVPAVAK